MDFHGIKIIFEINVFNILLFVVFLFVMRKYGRYLVKKKNMELTKVTISQIGIPVQEYNLNKDTEKINLQKQIDELTNENKALRKDLTTKVNLFYLIALGFILFFLGLKYRFFDKKQKKIEKQELKEKPEN